MPRRSFTPLTVANRYAGITFSLILIQHARLLVNTGMNRNDILFHLKYDIIPAQGFFADPEYWRETIRLLETDSIRSEPQQNLSAEQILFAPLATCSPKTATA